MSANDTTVGKTTRSGALKRILLFAGGAVGVGVAGNRALSSDNSTSAAAVSASVKPQRTHTFVLYGREWRLNSPATEPGKLPAAVDFPAPLGLIVDHRGRDLGVFRAVTLPSSGGAFQLHTFDLADGTILGIGSAGVHENPFAIVGGTGRYAGASGTYVAKQSLRELGGDGTAEFTLNVTA